MKKIFVVIAFVFSTTLGSNIYAQQDPPPGAGDKDLRDTDVKRRSIEMERIDRDARKSNKTLQTKAAAQAEDKLALKYADIKIDYEQIQLSQDAIIKTYQSAGKINYAQIGKSALEIKNSAARLNLNLFPTPSVGLVGAKTLGEKDEKTKKEAKEKKSMRDLIVELDNAVGSFATSPMFQNLRVVDAEVSAKAKLNLENIIELSTFLNAEAQKLKIGEK